MAPSAYRRQAASAFWLTSPNGVHFHPLAGVALPGMERGDRTMDLVTRMVEHDLWLTGRLLDREFSLSRRSAEQFMAAARRFGARSDAVSRLPAGAVLELSAPSVPDELVERVLAGELPASVSAIRGEKAGEQAASAARIRFWPLAPAEADPRRRLRKPRAARLPNTPASDQEPAPSPEQGDPGAGEGVQMKYSVTVVKFSGKRVVHTVEAERFEETGRKRRVFYDAEGRPVAEFQKVESVTSSPSGEPEARGTP